MFRYTLFLITNIFLTNIAFCKNADTTVVYYKNDNGIGRNVPSLDSADYFMLILPPDSADNRYNIQQFYKNGKLKFIGKSDPVINSSKTGQVILDGDCISYYPNGRRSSIAHYRRGYKDGMEYMYYPNNTIYCSIKHHLSGTLAYNEALNWECYDAAGNMICKDGNGQWILYDDSCKNIKLQGQVVKGYMEGEWHGYTLIPDTVRYLYHYKKGVVVSSTGYDKSGKSFPFEKEQESASYRTGQVTFLEVLRSHIKLPRDSNDKRMSIDTMHVSFVVEKDGRLDLFRISGEVSPQLKDAVFAGLSKCNGWNPLKIYGVPFRTLIDFPLSEITWYSSRYYFKFVDYRQRGIKDN